MLWFILTSTLLMALALLVPAAAGSLRRRGLEIAVLAVLLLPVLCPLLPVRNLDAGVIPDASSSMLPGFAAAAISLWGIGVLSLLLRALRQWRQLRRMQRLSRSLSYDEEQRVAQLLEPHGNGWKPNFRVSDLISTPMVLPGFPGCVLLPNDWMTWSTRMQRTILRHEWHHFRRHDAMLGCLMRSFAMLFWFHPLVWWLVSAWTAACEHEADRAATGDENPADYAEDLLSFAQGNTAAVPSMIPAFTRSRLARRIEILLAHPEARRRSEGLALLCVLAFIFTASACAWMGRPVRAAPWMQHEAETRLAASAFPADE